LPPFAAAFDTPLIDADIAAAGFHYATPFFDAFIDYWLSMLLILLFIFTLPAYASQRHYFLSFRRLQLPPLPIISSPAFRDAA
jgi:hypothetical protein